MTLSTPHVKAHDSAHVYSVSNVYLVQVRHIRSARRGSARRWACNVAIQQSALAWKMSLMRSCVAAATSSTSTSSKPTRKLSQDFVYISSQESAPTVSRCRPKEACFDLRMDVFAAMSSWGSRPGLVLKPTVCNKNTHALRSVRIKCRGRTCVSCTSCTSAVDTCPCCAQHHAV